MNLRSLRYFVAVVDAGSLTRAAVALHVAQPALSAQLKSLESTLGKKLLERSREGVVPTAAGIELYEGAQRLLADAAALSDRVGSVQTEPEGPVTMAFAALLAPALLGGILVEVRKKFPKIQISVVSEFSEIVVQSILNGKADFGLVAEIDTLTGCAIRPLVEEPYHFVGIDTNDLTANLLQHSLAGRNRHVMDTYPTIRFADAAALPLLTSTRQSTMRIRLEQMAASLGIKLNVAHEHASMDPLLALYEAQAGFSMAPVGVLSHLVHHPKAVCALIVEPEIVRTVGIAWLAGRKLSDASRAVIDVLRTEVALAIMEGRWLARHVDHPDYTFSD